MSILARNRVAIVTALAALFGLVLFWPRTPRFELVINQERVAEQVAASELPVRLAEWVDRERAREVVFEFEGASWRYRRADLGLFFSVGDGEEQIAQVLAQRHRLFGPTEVSVQLVDRWDLAVLEAALVPIRQATEREPVSAQLVPKADSVTIIPSVDGRTVETEAVVRLLRASSQAERLQVPVAPVEPEVSTGQVEALGIRRKIAEWTTHYEPNVPRAENVERAADAFNGLMLKPGETLSYNATVGPIDYSTGWKEAFVIVDGKLVPGVGGGVCQVATTLYGAALRANMGIVERHPHQLAVNYIPPSEDAAVAQGWEDLRIRNTTPGHLLIQSEAEGGTVTFRLYGDLPPGQEVKIESRVTGSQPFTVRYLDDPSLAPGSTVQVSAGSRGLRSEAYRLIYSNGELVRRELLSRDQYRPTEAVVRRGAGPSVVAGQE